MSAAKRALLPAVGGMIAGLRSLPAPAVVAWAAPLNWLNLRGSLLSFMGSRVAVVVFPLLALAELVADQLPSTPSRLKPPGLISRIVFGALSGAAIAAAPAQSIALGGVLGGVGGLAGAFAGYETRRRLGAGLQLPDFGMRCFEDLAGS